jgi:4-amino-4-deoxy-L-arabinose transferase-like glycosyltransferase
MDAITASPAVPAGAVPSRPAPSWARVVAWIAVAAAARAGLAAVVPLFPDETYYWEWSRRLASGYFDHPPGIALLIAMGTALFGPTTAGVRAGPALAAVLTHAAAAMAAWQLAGQAVSGRRAALRAAQLVALLPVATAGLVLATPDAVLFMAAMVALVAVERALAAPLGSRAALVWWGLAGVALGGAFVAKYTAVLLPMALVIACLLHPALRRRFAEPGPWVASAIALALFAPVVWWNAQHDWASIRFQLGHGLGRPPARGSALSRVLEMLGGQVGLASPILWGLMAAVVTEALREGWRARHALQPTDLGTRRFALGVMATVPLGFFALSALRKPVEANWPAMIYPAAILLLATATIPAAIGVWWRRGLWLAGLLVSVVALQALRPVLPVPPPRDPMARAYGWDSLAMAVDRARRDLAPSSGGTMWVAADRYQDASAMAFHLPDHPEVFSLNLGGRTNQYDVWPTAYARLQPGDALIAVFDDKPAGDSLAARVGTWFTTMQPGMHIVLNRAGGEITRRRLWRYTGARAVPAQRPLPSPSR